MSNSTMKTGDGSLSLFIMPPLLYFNYTVTLTGIQPLFRKRNRPRNRERRINRNRLSLGELSKR